MRALNVASRGFMGQAAQPAVVWALRSAGLGMRAQIRVQRRANVVDEDVGVALQQTRSGKQGLR